MIIHSANTAEHDRTEAFKAFARKRFKEEVAIPPILLPSLERRLYVRDTIREDHQFRISNNPEGAQAKFDKLASSAFTFFRGTALLFYRDYAGTDGHLPMVFTVGDVHPENFGVMPNENGVPFFGVNDFDEAFVAPFSYDIKRGSVGFYMVAKENGLKRKHRKQVVKAFVNGYLNGLKEFARDDREKWHEYRIDNSPQMIKNLLEASKKSRKEFLEGEINLEKGEFITSEEIVPQSKHCQKFQKVVSKYVKENKIDKKGKSKSFFKVKDVAVKKSSGTASLGLDRYYVLIEGQGKAADDNIILEFKQARRSALKGLVPENSQKEKEDEGHAGKIVKAHSVHLAGGDPYYGYVTFDKKEYLVREKSPYKNDIDVDGLGKKSLKKYADICGRTLAQTHARSDEDTGIMEGNAEERVLSSIRPEVFLHDMARFARVAADRIYKDYKFFKKDHAIGAFDFVRREGK